MTDSSRFLTILPLALLVATLGGLIPSAHAPAAAALADISINCSPGSLTLIAGNAGSSTCTVTSLNGFAGNVPIRNSTSPTGFLQVTVSSSIVTLTAGGTASVTVNIATTASTPQFAYAVDIVAWNIAGSTPVGHSFVLQTEVNPLGGPNLPDYAISLSTSSLTIVHGSSGSSTVTLTPSSFTGSVNLGATVAPAQSGGPAVLFAGGFNPGNPGTNTNATFIILPGPSYSVALNINTATTTPLGVYTVVIQTPGSSQPSLEHTAVLTVTVT